MIPLAIFVYVPKFKAFGKAMAEASAEGTVTPALRASLADPTLRIARVYEMLLVSALAWLMIAKPF